MSAAATDIRSAIQAARKLSQAGGGAVLDVLLRTSGLAAPALAEALHAQAGVDVVPSDGSHAPDFSQLDAASARRLRCVALRNGTAAPLLACADPWDDAVVRQAVDKLGAYPELGIAQDAQLAHWLGARSEVAATETRTAHDDGDAPVVAFVNDALQAAYRNGASDVHFECDRAGVTVKHRLDGVMKHYARMDGARSAEEVISRIKVMSQLDITERRIPQDGRCRLEVSGAAPIDLRISIMPSVFGEDAVLRLLDKAQLRGHHSGITLDSLGFDAASAERLRNIAQLPHGMLLVTGPTGSGKTTTVYAALSEVNTGIEKIITIEDPVEYELPGVLQIPVNERKGLTFAKGLRSILRHDPDRILVGEIRDAETAEIAIQSALTGHQVFTTVHANSIYDVLGRFRHFGLDMFGFVGALNAVVVQRLVRRVCTACCEHGVPTPQERQWLEQLQPGAAIERLVHARGCAQCHDTGYKGRFVLAEVHVVDDALRADVVNNAPVTVLKERIAQGGVQPLALQGLQRVLRGDTTLDEVRRVVGWL